MFNDTDKTASLAIPGGFPRDGFAGVATIAKALEVAAVYGAPASTLAGLAAWLEDCGREADATVDALSGAHGLDADPHPATPRGAAQDALSRATAAVGPIEGAAAVLADLARADAPSAASLHWLAFMLERAAREGRAALDAARGLLPRKDASPWH
jgi:hypothetical protein